MSDPNLIENYGYVPFYSFQYVILGLQFYMIYNYKYVNELMDKYIGTNDSQKQLKKIILSIPLLLIIYYDIRYSSFSFKNLGVNPAYNSTIKQILYISGSYGIIQVLAQDAGIKTAIVQENLVQKHILFALMSIGMAFSLTQNRSHSIIALILYYHLKYVISENIID
jgi:hypothetical protein